MRSPLYFLDKINDNNIYIKREDLLGFSFGGNKLRIAKKYFEDMIAKKGDHMIAYGPTTSNLCRVISNICSGSNTKCTIVSPVSENNESYNNKLSKLFGADIVYCNKNNVAESIKRVIDKSKADGNKPYYIYGDIYGNGNENVPASAYVDVYSEICEQANNNDIFFDYIFLACGTGSTYSGLLHGKHINIGHENIVAISIARDYKTEIEYISKYLKALKDTTTNDIILKDEYRLEYGKYDENIINTIKFVMSKYGIPLDPCYTGKAFHAMLNEIKNIKNKNILFIHTGGTPLFFDNMENIIK